MSFRSANSFSVSLRVGADSTDGGIVGASASDDGKDGAALTGTGTAFGVGTELIASPFGDRTGREDPAWVAQPTNNVTNNGANRFMILSMLQ